MKVISRLDVLQRRVLEIGLSLGDIGKRIGRLVERLLRKARRIQVARQHARLGPNVKLKRQGDRGIAQKIDNSVD